MTRSEHLLTIVGEECNEVAQRCSKALRFGMDEIQVDQPLTNQQRILQEFNDLVASMELLFNQPVDELTDRLQIAAKQAKVRKYLDYSVQCGTVNN